MPQNSVVSLHPIHPGAGLGLRPAASGLRFSRRHETVWDVTAQRTGKIIGTIHGDDLRGFFALIDGVAVGPFADVEIAKRTLVDGFTPLDLSPRSAARAA